MAEFKAMRDDMASTPESLNDIFCRKCQKKVKTKVKITPSAKQMFLALPTLFVSCFACRADHTHYCSVCDGKLYYGRGGSRCAKKE